VSDKINEISRFGEGETRVEYKRTRVRRMREDLQDPAMERSSETKKTMRGVQQWRAAAREVGTKMDTRGDVQEPMETSLYIGRI
jgi:hypothetical protein